MYDYFRVCFGILIGHFIISSTLREVTMVEALIYVSLTFILFFYYSITYTVPRWLDYKKPTFKSDLTEIEKEVSDLKTRMNSLTLKDGFKL